MDGETSVASLREAVARFIDERDWGRFQNPKDLAVAIASESGELLERFLWRTPEEAGAPALALHPEVVDELADVMIYCLAYANATGLDLSTAVRSKLEKNAAKYPVDQWKGRAP